MVNNGEIELAATF